MNILKKTFVLCALLLGASPVLAQTVTIGTPTPASAAGGQVVTVPVNFASGATPIGGLTVDVVVSTTQFSNVAISCAGQGTGAALAICTTPDGAAGGKMRFNFAGDSVNPFTTGIMGTLTLTVAAAAVPNASQAIDGTVAGAGNVSGSDDVNTNLITMVDSSLNIVGPAYTSTPVSGGGTEFVFGPVQQNAALPSQNLTITNTGAGTLSGTCTETLDAGNVFTITNGAYSAGASLNDTVTVACSSAGAIATHIGTMSCTHNGGNVASPVIYDLSCQLTAGPQPAYTSSNPVAGGNINLSVTEAGDPDPSQVMTITNSGAATTTLTGSCSMLGGSDAQITVNSTGAFNLAQNAFTTRTVSCDASTQGNYSGTLSCTHNGSSPTSPVNYPVSCVVPEAGSAVFASSPAPGPIDVDNGGDVVVDDPDPTRMLTFFNNADPGDQDLDLSCSLSGDAAITVSPNISAGISIDPASSSAVTFTCDTANSGNFTATYTCNYQNGGVDQPVGNSNQAIYNLTCGVRKPESDVVPNPAPGPLNASIPPGGTATFQIAFPEVNDEGEDATLTSCTLDGAPASGFSITSPTFPQTITSGSSVTVTVSATDPGGAESLTDTLRCIYTDSDSVRQEVVYPLTVNIGGNAEFQVLKEFTDGNPGNVTVDLDCNTGLILDQSKVISEDGIGVTFVVTDFDAGELDCNVTERPVAGYSADYEAGGDSDNTDANDGQTNPGCYWTEVAGSDFNTCVITNSPDPADVVITKEWLYPGSADATSVSDEFFILLYCEDAEIVDDDKYCRYQSGTAELPASVSYDSCKWLEGSGNTTFNVEVIPYDWPGGSCYATEVDVDQAVEVENGCATPMTVSAGSGAACTITNTVFFEGIPTLSQYGMALMALLMLGVGFVAVRRIA